MTVLFAFLHHPKRYNLSRDSLVCRDRDAVRFVLCRDANLGLVNVENCRAVVFDVATSKVVVAVVVGPSVLGHHLDALADRGRRRVECGVSAAASPTPSATGATDHHLLLGLWRRRRNVFNLCWTSSRWCPSFRCGSESASRFYRRQKQCDQIGRFFCTLGNFLKPLAAINLPKSPTFSGNFCTGVKIDHFSSEIIFRQLLYTFGDFFSGHTGQNTSLSAYHYSPNIRSPPSTTAARWDIKNVQRSLKYVKRSLKYV